MSKLRSRLDISKSNWRASPLPVPRKLGVMLRNNYLKLRHLETCCGHEGEPGC